MDGFIPFTKEKLETDEGIRDLNAMMQKIYNVISDADPGQLTNCLCRRQYND